jgi:uncharacterized membrane protein required for colicin V production
MDGSTIASIVTLGIIAIGTISGGIKGLARQIIELLGLIVSFLVAAVASTWLAALLHTHASFPHAPALVISFIAVFVSGLVAFHFVAIAIQRLIHTSLLGWLDRACGAALGLVAMTFVVSILATMALDMPLPDKVRAALDGSTVVNFVQPVAGWMFDLVLPHRSHSHVA